MEKKEIHVAVEAKIPAGERRSWLGGREGGREGGGDLRL
jgi:hypothetical protein